ncbi:MAG: agmatine deiminase family protein, partial [Bacteroidota bacterium]
MKKDTMIFALLLAVSTFFSACEKENIDSPPFEALDPQVPSTPTNTVSDDRMLLVLKAPSLEEMQYEGLDAQTFTEILDFTINYANSVIGKDNVVVVCEPATKAYLSGRLPEDIILVGGINHIWMRDFTVVNPYAPVQFDYTDATMSRSESNLVQATWTNFANLHNLDFSATDYELDGGNIVDDYDGRVITTTRFLEDNNLSYAEGVQVLKELLGATEVGIIPPDEDALAHSDGMVMWAEKNVLLVNDFSFDPQLRQGVMTELNRAF